MLHGLTGSPFLKQREIKQSPSDESIKSTTMGLPGNSLFKEMLTEQLLCPGTVGLNMAQHIEGFQKQPCF